MELREVSICDAYETLSFGIDTVKQIVLDQMTQRCGLAKITAVHSTSMDRLESGKRVKIGRAAQIVTKRLSSSRNVWPTSEEYFQRDIRRARSKMECGRAATSLSMPIREIAYKTQSRGLRLNLPQHIRCQTQTIIRPYETWLNKRNRLVYKTLLKAISRLITNSTGVQQLQQQRRLESISSTLN